MKTGSDRNREMASSLSRQAKYRELLERVLQLADEIRALLQDENTNEMMGSRLSDESDPGRLHVGFTGTRSPSIIRDERRAFLPYGSAENDEKAMMWQQSGIEPTSLTSISGSSGALRPQQLDVLKPNPASQLLSDYSRALYNREEIDSFWERYRPKTLDVSNAADRMVNPQSEPTFLLDRGPFLAIEAGGQNYDIVPDFECTINTSRYEAGGFGYVFECEGYTPGKLHRIHSLIQPARFSLLNGKWILIHKGSVTLLEKS